MATANPVLKDTAPAGADLSSSQFLFVKLNGSGSIVLCVLGDAGFSLEDKPKSGEHGTFVLAGIAKVVAGAAVAEMARVTADASGRAIVAIATNNINGIALSPAAAAGEVIDILVTAGSLF